MPWQYHYYIRDPALHMNVVFVVLLLLFCFTHHTFEAVLQPPWPNHLIVREEFDSGMVAKVVLVCCMTSSLKWSFRLLPTRQSLGWLGHLMTTTTIFGKAKSNMGGGGGGERRRVIQKTGDGEMTSDGTAKWVPARFAEEAREGETSCSIKSFFSGLFWMQCRYNPTKTKSNTSSQVQVVNPPNWCLVDLIAKRRKKWLVDDI